MMNPNLEGLSRLAWVQLWQVTVVALVIGAVVRLCCRAQPRVAYALWMLVVVKSIVPPVWSSPTGLFSWALAGGAPARSDVTGEPTGMVQNGPMTAPLDGGMVHSAPVMEGRSAGRSVHDRAGDWSRVHVAMFSIWATGLVLCAATVLGKQVACTRMIRQASVPVDERFLASVADLARRLNVRRRVRLIVASQPIGPAVSGLLRPAIVVPEPLLSGMSQEQVELVLAHEMIHVRRNDILASHLQLVAQLIWWFHPVVWWVNRQAGCERERCCDQEVVSGVGGKRGLYARTLLSVVEQKGRLRSLVALPGVRALEVTSLRLESIMKYTETDQKRASRLSRCAFAIGVALVVPGTGLSLQANDKTDRQSPPASEKPADVTLRERAQDAPVLDPERAIARIHELGGTITRDETKPDHPVNSVTLKGARVTDADLALLTGMTELKTLSLEKTRITGDGLDRLNGLTSLSGLSLMATEVTDDLAEHVSKLRNLNSLIIVRTQMSGVGLDRLTRIDDLNRLHLSNVTVTGVLPEHAKPNSGLLTLTLSNCVITDPLAAYLGELSGLRFLSLDTCTVTDSTLSYLKGMTNLIGLDLQGAKITDAGLAHLKGMTELFALKLDRTGITDAGLSHLAGMTRLRNLGLDDTKVTEAGVKRLREAIPQVVAVPFSPAPERAFPRLSSRAAVAPAVRGQEPADLAQQQAIARIYELGGTITRDETKPERPVIHALLKGTTVTDADLAVLTGLSDLKILILIGTRITGEGLDHLAELTNWRMLSLFQTEVADSLVDHVTKLTGVTGMSLTDSSITFTGLDRIARKSNIGSLSLWNVRIAGEAVEPPKTAPKLTYVQLTRSAVTDALLDYLAGMRELTLLQLAESTVTDAGLSRLKGLTNLRFLRLNGTKITDAGLEHLKGMTELLELNLSRTDVTDAGLADLKGFAKLSSLDLTGTQVTDAGVKAFRQERPGVTVKY